jgi:hypothetical protein
MDFKPQALGALAQRQQFGFGEVAHEVHQVNRKRALSRPGASIYVAAVGFA